MRSLRPLWAAAALLGTMSVANLAFAQTGQPQSQGQGQTRQAQAPAHTYNQTDARAVLNARLAALKVVMELTPEQERLWPPVEQAIRDIVRGATQRSAQRIDAARPAHFLNVLGVIAEAEEARGRELRRFVDAARPLVNALGEEQRRRIPAFLGMTDSGAYQPSTQLWLFEEEEG